MTSTSGQRPASRQTWQRTAISELLRNSAEFRSAAQVHLELQQSGARVALATVYRALQAMAESGEVDTIRNVEGEVVYRRCSTGHHHHLTCRNCGKSVEISAAAVESWAQQIGAEHGFVAVGHEIELFGICENCQLRADVGDQERQRTK